MVSDTLFPHSPPITCSSCLGSRIDMVSNLDLIFMIFALFFSITTQQNTQMAAQLMSIEIMIVYVLGVPNNPHGVASCNKKTGAQLTGKGRRSTRDHAIMIPWLNAARYARAWHLFLIFSFRLVQAQYTYRDASGLPGKLIYKANSFSYVDCKIKGLFKRRI